MTQKLFKGLFILCFILFIPARGISYDTDIVHPEINEEASRKSTSLGTTLQNLGFNTGVDSIVNNEFIYDWFREGGTNEDIPIIRAFNHFHDPLETWDNAGYAGGISSIIWAQSNPFGPDPLWQGDWSWQKAREYYYNALTDADRNSRETALADTFRALGQVMHLLADSSVPAHTRNDTHVLPLREVIS